MKRFVCLAVGISTLFTAAPALAQHEDHRVFIGLGIGPSVPFGDFADKSLLNAEAGHALAGYTSTLINFSYRHANRFGIAGAFSYSEYSMDEADGDDWWQVAGLTIGPMYSIPISARAAVDVRAMFGLLAMTPVIDSHASNDDTGPGIGVDMRAAFRYDIFRSWAVFADAGLQAANVTFNSGERTDLRTLISGFGIAFRPGW
jgi:opacity protein-like surface antigen